ncbi:MAG: hypothetical protein E7051_10440, partial [Lentisphaerae bacterium]|nr:hypothetical protein [Lentisphaerota bacterium]
MKKINVPENAFSPDRFPRKPLAFNLVELPVKKSHLCCNYVDDNEKAYSPVCRQVKQFCFTLIELLVSSTLSSLHFFAQKFFRTAGNDLSSKSIPLFLKRGVGFGERGKTSFPARAAGCGKTRPSVFVSLRRDESLRWGSDNDI